MTYFDSRFDELYYVNQYYMYAVCCFYAIAVDT
jgi:hypothetical protein